MFLWLLGCSAWKVDTAESLPWFEVTAWRIAEIEHDVFPDHQPEEIECPITGFQVEIDQLEIQTDVCNYAVIEWETLHPVPANTTLEALVLHTGLWAPEEGTAHFALSINGELFWEDFPPIPSNTEFFFYEAIWPNEIPVGSTLQLHLHNHGANDWKLGYFQPQE